LTSKAPNVSFRCGQTVLRKSVVSNKNKYFGRGLVENMRPSVNAIHSKVEIGHVHLKVADLERSLGFYCGVLGFEISQRMGNEAAFVSAGGYHHHIGLNTWESKNGIPPPQGTTGLYHFAIRYPTRQENGCARLTSSWKAPATTVSAKHSTCATPMATDLNFTGTGPA
jgi:catechol-2,3-dioxygenase